MNELTTPTADRQINPATNRATTSDHNIHPRREAYQMLKTRLLTATAMALVIGMGGLANLAPGQAQAATSISSATTAPVTTSTTGDLTVDSSGSITLTSGTAITVDSDNKVTLNGPIVMTTSAGNSTGILINGGHTSGLTVAANITVTDSYTGTDTKNADTILDGPFSDNLTRYGIHSLGATPFIGNVSVTSASTMQVEGDNSYAIRFENKVQGDFTFDGAINMLGNGTTGISLENGVTGNVYLSGKITTQGKDSRDVFLSGDIGGALNIDGTYTATGYATASTLSNDATKAVLATPEDLYQGGPAVWISSNVAKGILINSTVATDSTKTSTDQDGDGNADTTQSTASLTSYGSAPALRIASASQDQTIGGVQYNSSAVSPPAINYGLLIRGNVTGSGVYQGIDNTAIEIGGLGHSVTVANGVVIKGAVNSSAVGGNSTALSLMSGAYAPLLDVTGTLKGAASSSTLSTTTGTTTTYATVGNTTANAINIAVGATLPTINVGASGGIYADATGSTEKAVAIRDQSNTLSTITNNNIISTNITASDDNGDGVGDKVLNHGIAIDTSGNTLGLNLTIIDTAPTDDSIAAPYISGDILLGSGDDNFTANGGVIVGDVNFGAGANSFTLLNKANYIGRITGAGSVQLDVSSGILALSAGSKLNTTTLHVGATGTLGITLATATPTIPVMTGSGAAVFDNGAQLKLSLDKLVTAPQTYTVLTASNISLGTLATSLDGFIPYLYHADLVTDTAKTTLYANFRLKTQAENKFSDNEQAALAPVLTAAANDAGATSSLVTQLDKAGFDKIYSQYLPDYSGENLLNLAQGVTAVGKSLAALTLVPDNTDGQWWMQEYGYKVTRKYGDTSGFKSTGFSFAMGREIQVYGNQMVGLYGTYTSGSPLDTFAIAKENMVNSDATLGAYWRLRTGGFKGWAHAGAGFAQFRTTRELLTSYVNHIATAKWNGYSASAGAGASYEMAVGSFSVTPQVTADYYKLSEGKHTEKGGQQSDGSGDYFDLDIAKRDSHLLTSTAQFNVAYTGMFVKPELWIGYKQNLSAQIANTVANFAGGTPFTLTGGNIKGGGPIAGFRVSVDNQYSYLGLEASYEKLDAYENASVSLRARFQF